MRIRENKHTAPGSHSESESEAARPGTQGSRPPARAVPVLQSSPKRERPAWKGLCQLLMLPVRPSGDRRAGRVLRFGAERQHRPRVKASGQTPARSFRGGKDSSSGLSLFHPHLV